MLKIIKTSYIIILCCLLSFWGCSNDNNNIDKIPNVYLKSKFSTLENGKKIIIGGIGIETTEMDNIIVSDKFDFKLKYFDKNGELLFATGDKGNGPGEYKNGPSFVCYDKFNHFTAVADIMTSKVSIFNQKLTYINSILAQRPVSDLDYDSKGNLIVAMIPIIGLSNSIVIYKTSGEQIQSFNPKKLLNNFYYNAFLLNYNRYYNKIVIAFRFRNLIQVYKVNGNMVAEYSIKGLPEKSASMKMNLGTASLSSDIEIPSNSIFKDMASDNNGNIYLLLGNINPKYIRKVLEVSIDGNLIRMESLLNNSNYITIDNHNHLLALDHHNMSITKYVLPK